MLSLPGGISEWMCWGMFGRRVKVGTEKKTLLCEPHMYTGTVTAVSPVREVTATTYPAPQ